MIFGDSQWSGTGGTITDEELKEKIVEISGLLQPTEIQNLEKKSRNAMLKQLCEYGANIRQISRVTGISYGVIYRAKNDHRMKSPGQYVYGQYVYIK